MSLPNYLAKIKSSGIYRFVWDKSEIAGVDAEILRLVVGYSEKGPFNTPVYVKSENEFKSIYGGISKKLEKRGIWFHRMALQCLQAGPIICLNLKKFNGEKLAACSFNVVDTIASKEIPVESIYDTSRFWKLDPEAISSAVTEVDTTIKNKYISISAADSSDASCSLFIRGYKPNGYDVTVKNWFASQGEDVPEYFVVSKDGKEYDYSSLLVSDFFAEIYVFKGEFTKALVSSDPLNRYFDIVNGEVQLKEYVENAFGEKVDTLPLLAAESASNFVNSYSGCLLPYFKSNTGSYISLDLVFNSDYNSHKMMMNLNSDLLYGGDITPMEITTTCWTTGATDKCFGILPKRTEMVYNPDSDSYSDVEGKEATVFDPDFIKYEGASVQKSVSGHKYNLEGLTDIVINNKTVSTDKYVHDEDCLVDSEGEITEFYVYNNKLYKSTGEEINNTLDDVNKVHDFVSLGFEVSDRILEGTTLYTITEVLPTQLKVTDFEGNEHYVSITSEVLKCNHSCTITNYNLSPRYFKGYVFSNSKPDGNTDYAKLTWQKDILSAIVDYEGIRQGLTSRTDLDYRYIVDTFEAYVDSEVHKELALICKEKDNAFAFLNFPAIKTFKNCAYSSFLDDKGRFQVKYIKEGANKQKNPGRLFSLVSEANGASFADYTTPLMFSDGTVKTCVPSAALVSNNFMAKYESRQPYYIVAGPNYGRIIADGLVGPDFNFTRADLDILEPMGVNALVYVPRIGTYINSNQTAKQNPVTALSKINIRELVIYLQDEIEKLLQDYQWEFNTQQLRDLVKQKADTICDRIKNNGGIAKYQNVCDESNNTSDVINNEMFVLSTSIEPGFGCGKMVQELTIYKQGGMSSTIS